LLAESQSRNLFAIYCGLSEKRFGEGGISIYDLQLMICDCIVEITAAFGLAMTNPAKVLAGLTGVAVSATAKQTTI
jgi:hypothetical protein